MSLLLKWSEATRIIVGWNLVNVYRLAHEDKTPHNSLQARILRSVVLGIDYDQ